MNQANSTRNFYQGQSNASNAMGVIRTAPRDTVQLPSQFGWFTFALLGGTQTPIMVEGHTIYIESIRDTLLPTLSAETYGVTLLTSANDLIPLNGEGKSYHWSNGFRYVTILVPAGSQAVTINLYIGFGSVEESLASAPITSIGSVVSRSINFNRPNNIVAYAANQAVAENGGPVLATYTFSTIARIPSGMFTIQRVRMVKNSVTVLNASFRLYLFDQFTLALTADQAVFPLMIASIVSRATAIIDLPAFVTSGAGSDSAVCDLSGLAVRMAGAADRSCVGLLVAMAAYIPTALERININLVVQQD